jgi:hypothetical protein
MPIKTAEAIRMPYQRTCREPIVKAVSPGEVNKPRREGEKGGMRSNTMKILMSKEGGVMPEIRALGRSRKIPRDF